MSRKTAAAAPSTPARVTVHTQIIPPRWNNRLRRQPRAVDDLGHAVEDIKRHEERHAEIARTQARSMERARYLRRRRNPIAKPCRNW